MEVSAHLAPLGGADSPPGYLVRIWVPVHHVHEYWRTSDWWLTGADSVEDVIEWARDHSSGSPSEVFVVGDAGTLLRLWGAEPDDASVTVEIELRGDAGPQQR